MDAGELLGTIKSVHRYRVKWRAQGHTQTWLWKQAARGRLSGVARRAGSLTERQPWADLGVSRATWYRRFGGAKADGESLGRRCETRTNTGSALMMGCGSLAV